MLKQTIVTTIATGSILLSSVGFAFADTAAVVGNGALSQNQVNVSSSNSTNVNQNNTTDVTNTVKNNANTGGNQAGFNTNGNVSVRTGNASATTDISNVAGSNQATVSNCNCGANGLTADISGNGAESRNAVGVSSANNTTLGQNNNTTFNNKVTNNLDSGKNNAGFNTGGTVSVMTGNTNAQTTISNLAGANTATVGGSANAGSGTGTTAAIVGNGALSQNTLGLAMTNSTTVSQNNSSRFTNDVTSNENTGNNDAGFNTGGNVNLSSGGATATTDITNAAGFNSADVTACGCTVGGDLLKIVGNGALSANAMNANFANSLMDSQNNSSTYSNPVTSTLDTGSNNLGYNTGSVMLGGLLSDPSTSTGNTSSSTSIHNSGNVNSFGPNATLTLPGNLGNMQFTSDFSGMWNAFASWWAMASH